MESWAKNAEPWWLNAWRYEVVLYGAAHCGYGWYAVARQLTDEDSQVGLAALAMAMAAACVIIGKFPLDPVFGLTRGFYANMLKDA